MRVEPRAASASRCDAIENDLLFSRECRLTCKRQFDHVLITRTVQVRQECFRVYAAPNEEASARLGLIVGKRQLKRAVDRNRVKRVLREAFRLQRATIPSMDIVIQLVAPPLDVELWERANTLWSSLISTIGKQK